MNMRKLKTVLFDLDGTLLDTAPDLGFALNKLLEQKGLANISIDKVRQVASDGCRGLLALGFHMDDQHPEYNQYRDNLLKFYQQHLCVNTALFPGMAAVLTQLEAQGIEWGVVTNKASHLAKELLTNLELASRCVCIIGGDCVTQPKPHPEPLLLACKLSDSSPNECVYIGDAERDIEAAKYAGMRSIAALYGYLRKDSSPEFWQADYYVDHPKDILCWLEKQMSYSL